MDKMVVIYTQAYNAEGTLQRTIDSVKNQTYTNWIHFVIDNASSDGTGKIIINAAQKDTRVIPYRLSQNNIAAYIRFWLLLKKNYPDCYFMALDADDVIEPMCLEKMLGFMEENELDIVACGTDFCMTDIDGADRVVRSRCLEANLIFDGKQLAEKFTVYKPYTNEYWAKLYKFDVVTEEALVSFSIHHYDSMSVLKMFGEAKRLGITAEVLHKAYIGAESLSQAIKGVGGGGKTSSPIEEQVAHWLDGTPYIRTVAYTDKSWEHVNATFGEYKNFLARYGEITSKNKEYLGAIYIEWIHENLTCLYLAYASVHGGLMYQNIRGVISSDAFREVFTYHPASGEYLNYKKRKGILEQMYHYLSISEFCVNNVEFIKQTKDAVLRLQEEMCECQSESR